MKRILFVCAVAAAVFCGCSNSSVKQENAAGDSTEVTKDSVQEPVDTFDVAAFNGFSTADLRTFWLKGHVKQLVEVDNKIKNVIDFSPEGRATVKSYYGCDCKLTRDGEGHIVTIGTVLDESQEGTFFTLEYDAVGNVIRNTCEMPSYFESDPSNYGKYNEQGWPTTCKASGGEGGYYFETDVTYTYEGIDEVGNWTVRKESGKMTEYDADDVSSTQKVSGKVTRTLTYYTREELGM